MEVCVNFTLKTKVNGRHNCRVHLKLEEGKVTTSLVQNPYIDFHLNGKRSISIQTCRCGPKFVVFYMNIFHDNIFLPKLFILYEFVWMFPYYLKIWRPTRAISKIVKWSVRMVTFKNLHGEQLSQMTIPFDPHTPHEKTQTTRCIKLETWTSSMSANSNLFYLVGMDGTLKYALSFVTTLRNLVNSQP